MSFITHKASMKDFCESLKNVEMPTGTQSRLREILEYLCDHCHHFEDSVSDSTPFYDEFFYELQEKFPHQEVCFALLECLIMFCRERQLKAKNAQHLPEPERKLLHYYEQSHHWNAADETLLHTWYWDSLPKMYKEYA